MKIAFVIPGGGGGGVRSVVRIASGLANRGHQLRILYRRGSRRPRDLARRAYLRLRYGSRSDWLRGFAGEALSYEHLTPESVGDQDVVVGVGVSCVLEIARLPAHCGIKIHNSRGVEPWIPGEMREAWRQRMPRIVVGRHLVRLMRSAGSRDPIYVAHNGVDRTAYYPTLPEHGRQAVGAVYHGAEVKDPELLFGTLARLHRKRPTLPLQVFGSYPKPKRMPSPVAYTRLPRLSVAREIYSRCAVWFLTSRNEGLPNPILEAMACGCAVVSTDCGGAGDIIQNEQNGLLTPCGDADAMVAAIERLLLDEPLRTRLRLASEATLGEFTWPRAVDAFEQALLDIVQNGGNPDDKCESRQSVLVG